MPELKRDITFLSYAHEDLEQIWKIYKGLKKRGVDVWFDKEDLGKGRWKQKILNAINRSKNFVFCLSNAALKKTHGEKPGFQDDELQYAYEIAVNQPEDKFTIVPVRLEDCDRGDHRISIFQQHDLFPDVETGLDKLAVDLGGVSLADATARDERTEDEKMVAGLMGKSLTFYYSGEYEKALSISETVITINPGKQEAWVKKGVFLSALGRKDEAMKAFNKAIEIKPD
ncbi:MAG: TIR domain-containing protein, partial [bacterium]|nr:TIR domain-containing protein [bacterium]